MMDKTCLDGVSLVHESDGPMMQPNGGGCKLKITSTSSCNRLRITADGKIKVCLFGSNEKEVISRGIMRSSQDNGKKLQEEKLGNVIQAAV
ncbi:hypothetical protein ACHAWF_005404 [Thalassiosira exigua]